MYHTVGINPLTNEDCIITFGYKEVAGSTSYFLLINNGEQKFLRLDEALFLKLWKRWHVDENLIQP